MQSKVQKLCIAWLFLSFAHGCALLEMVRNDKDDPVIDLHVACAELIDMNAFGVYRLQILLKNYSSEAIFVSPSFVSLALNHSMPSRTGILGDNESVYCYSTRNAALKEIRAGQSIVVSGLVTGKTVSEIKNLGSFSVVIRFQTSHGEMKNQNFFIHLSDTDSLRETYIDSL